MNATKIDRALREGGVFRAVTARWLADDTRLRVIRRSEV